MTHKTKNLSADEVRERLRKACEDAGSQAAWARDHGVSPAFVCDVLCGRRQPGELITLGLDLLENPRSWREIGVDFISAKA